LVSELTVMGELAPLFDPLAPPLLEVHEAVNPVMALPPVLPAVKATLAEVADGVTAEIVGAPGTPAATKLDEAAEAAPLPTALVASTVQV
jgi:hypothetical protein